MLLSFTGEGDVVILGFDIIEFGDGNDMDPSSIAHDHALSVFSGRSRCRLEFRNGRKLSTEALFRPSECLFETLGAERFEQIVHRMNLESSQCMLIVSSCEDDGHVGAD